MQSCPCFNEDFMHKHVTTNAIIIAKKLWFTKKKRRGKLTWNYIYTYGKIKQTKQMQFNHLVFANKKKLLYIATLSFCKWIKAGSIVTNKVELLKTLYLN